MMLWFTDGRIRQQSNRPTQNKNELIDSLIIIVHIYGISENRYF